MPAWLTTYLKRLPEFDAPTLRDGLDDADWWTLAEDLELEDEEIDGYVNRIAWHEDDGVAFSSGDERPVVIHVWDDADRVRVEVEEVDGRGLEVPPSVRNRLPEVTAVVALELGFSQLDTMAEIVALEVAYWLCTNGDGVMLTENEDWYAVGHRGWEPLSCA